MQRATILPAFTLAVCTLLAPFVIGATEPPEEAWIEQQLAAGELVGAVIADIRGDDVTYRAFGTLTAGGSSAPDSQTRFEIGSITKALTNLLLAELVAKDVVEYETTVDALWPGIDYANAEVGSITLEELATHTSGLPRLPGNFNPADHSDPYTDFDVPALREALATSRAGQPLAKRYAYSNLGVGLLGYLLGRAAGSDYATALDRHVLEPLGLADVTVGCRGEGFAPGHSGGKAVPNWNLSALAGAGALCADARSMVRLLSMYLDDKAQSPLAHDLDDDLVVQHPAGGNMAVTRVWHVARGADRQVYWHNGGTGGYRSFAGFDPAVGSGRVVLVNSTVDVTSFGLGAFGLEQPDGGPDVSPEAGQTDQFAAYTGHFEITPSFGISVTAENGTLYVQATGQPRLTLVESGEDRFSLLEVDAGLEFVRDESGAVNQVILHQAGRAMPGKRVAEPVHVRAFEEIDIDPAVLDDYVGRYRLAPGADFIVKRIGDALEVKLASQPSFPVFPYDEDRFFYKVVDAQLTFNREDGKVVSLTLHQNGMDQVAPKQD